MTFELFVLVIGHYLKTLYDFPSGIDTVTHMHTCATLIDCLLVDIVSSIDYLRLDTLLFRKVKPFIMKPYLISSKITIIYLFIEKL